MEKKATQWPGVSSRGGGGEVAAINCPLRLAEMKALRACAGGHGSKLDGESRAVTQTFSRVQTSGLVLAQTCSVK